MNESSVEHDIVTGKTFVVSSWGYCLRQIKVSGAKLMAESLMRDDSRKGLDSAGHFLLCDCLCSQIRIAPAVVQVLLLATQASGKYEYQQTKLSLVKHNLMPLLNLIARAHACAAVFIPSCKWLPSGTVKWQQKAS